MTIKEGPSPKWESKLYEYQHPPKNPRTGFQLQRLKEREQNRQLRKTWRKRRDRLLRWKARAEAAVKENKMVKLYIPHEEQDLQAQAQQLEVCKKSTLCEIQAQTLLNWIDHQYTRPTA